MFQIFITGEIVVGITGAVILVVGQHARHDLLIHVSPCQGMLLYSALIIIMMWIRPQGLVGSINRKVPEIKEKTETKKGGVIDGSAS